MSTYPAGTVAVATVLGVPGVRVSRYIDGWARLDDPDIFYNDIDGLPSLDYVTDIRPLVVLDLDAGILNGPSEVARGLRILADNDNGGRGTFRADKARAIADAIEAQTKPPRIDEPGRWGVVRASVRELLGADSYVNYDGRWVDKQGRKHAWSDLIDPVLVREGI